jgi:hypothetical protein
MTSRPSPFADAWRQCLRMHYKSVIARGDGNTEATLTGILARAGFTQQELDLLRVEALARDPDTTPEQVAAMERTYRAHPAECTCPTCTPLDDGLHDEEGQPLAADALHERAQAAAYEPGQVHAVAVPTEWPDSPMPDDAFPVPPTDEADPPADSEPQAAPSASDSADGARQLSLF